MTSDGGVAATAQRPGNVDRDNPWPGLAAFREADRQFFQGRDAETRDLVRLMERERVAVLLGRSGLGKTSLLQAGLFPVLRERAYLPIYLRLDFTEQPDASALRRQVIEAVEEEARAREVEVPSSDGVDSLWEYFHRADARFWGRKSRLLLPLLVFDQFEEIFTLGREPPLRGASDAFLTELGDLAEGRLPARLRERLHTDPDGAARFTFDRHHYKVLLSLREDFLPDLESLRERLGPAIFNRLRLYPMSGTAALGVVAQADHLITRDVAEEVVRFVAAGQPGTSLHELVVDPALLSVVCRELNLKRRRRAIPRITADLLEGSREEILEEFYERSVEDLPQRVRVFVEDELVTVSGFRDSVALDNALGAGITREEIARLEDNRLVRVDARGGLHRLELSHDRLTSVVALSRDDRRRREQREAEEAERRAEEAARRARNRRRFLTTGAVAVALLLVGSLIINGMRQRGRQESLRRDLVVATVERLGPEGDPLLRALLLSELETGSDHPGRTVNVALQLLGTAIPRVVFSVPDDGITAAAFSPSGDRIVTGHASGSVRVWPVDGATPPSVHERHNSRITFLSIGPDGSLLTASENGDVLLWSPDLNGADALPPQVDWIYQATLSPNGLRALIATDSATVLLRTDGSDSVPLTGAGDGVSGAEFDPTGRRLIAVSRDGRVWLWDLDQPSQPRELCRIDGCRERTRSREPIHAAAFANGGVVVTASDSGKIEVWDLVDGGVVAELGKHTASAWSIDLSPDGSRLVTASADSTARVWDLEGGSESFALRGHAGAVRDALFSPDGTSILTVSDDGTARLWPAATPSAARLLRGHEGEIRSVHSSSDGMRIISEADDTIVRVWELGETRESLSDGESRGSRALAHPARVMAVDVLPDQPRLVTVAEDGAARVWSLDAPAEAVVLRAPEAEGPICQAALSPDATEVAVSTCDGALRVVPADGSGPGILVSEAAGSAPRVAYGPRGDRLLTWSAQKSAPALIWRAVAGVEPVPLAGHQEQVNYASFSPDGSQVVTASADSTVRLWRDDGTGGEVRLKHAATVRRAVFSPDGRWVVSASWDRTAAIAAAEGSEPGVFLVGHRRRVNSARFSPRGSRALRVLTTSNDGTARVWWEPWTDEPAVLDHGKPVMDGIFTPDGSHVVTASSDSTVRVWSIDPGQLLSRLRRSTLACLTMEERMRYLRESALAAARAHRRCERDHGRGEAIVPRDPVGVS